MVEREVEMPHVITSTRELIPLTSADVKLFGKPISTLPTGYGGYKWSRRSIQAFLAGKVYYGDQPGRVSYFNTFFKIKEQLKYYMELEEEEYTVLALWVMHTYYVQLFGTSPILFLNAIKGSGKSKLQQILSYMVFNGMYCVEPSDASIFRVAHHDKATILIDEVERIREDTKAGLRVLLNGRYHKGMVVTRVEPAGAEKKLTVNKYGLFGATSLANINGIDNVLEDRCITLILKRALNAGKANTEPEPAEKAWQEIRDDQYCLMLNPSFFDSPDHIRNEKAEAEGYKMVKFFMDFWEGNKQVGDEVSALDPDQKNVLMFIKEVKTSISRHTTLSGAASVDSADNAESVYISGGGGKMPVLPQFALQTMHTMRTMHTMHEKLPVQSVDSADSAEQNTKNMENTQKKGGSEYLYTHCTLCTVCTGWLIGRTLQLWKPLLMLACCVDASEAQEFPLKTVKTVIDYARKHTMQRRMEEATESQDVMILGELIKNFKEDGWFKLKPFHSKLKEEMEWLRIQRLGLIMKRLGFVNKRRIAQGTEYLLMESQLRKMCLQLRLDYDALRKDGEEERSAKAQEFEDFNLQQGRAGWRAPQPSIEEALGKEGL